MIFVYTKNIGPHTLWLALVVFIFINFSSLSAQVDDYSSEKMEQFAEIYLQQKITSQRLVQKIHENPEITRVISEEKYKKALEESFKGKELSLSKEERQSLEKWVSSQSRLIKLQLREDLMTNLSSTELNIEQYDEMCAKLERDILFADRMKPYFQKIIETRYQDE